MININKYLLLLFLLGGCSNTYFFNKSIDDFNPEAKKLFIVEAPNNKYYAPIISYKLTEKMKNIPLVESSTIHANYTVYFNYKKAYFIFPMLGVNIIKNPMAAGEVKNTLVYSAVVYSYNTKLEESLAASLKIITDDLVYHKYTKSTLVNITLEDLKAEAKKYKQQQEALKIKEKNKETSKTNENTKLYKLYSNEKYYGM